MDKSNPENVEKVTVRTYDLQFPVTITLKYQAVTVQK